MGKTHRPAARHVRHAQELEKDSDHVHTERQKAELRRKKKQRTTWLFVALAVLILGMMIYALWPKPSPYLPFAECLAEAGAVMYGADWCENCQAQKRMFGTAFKQVPYTNCDYGNACAAQDVRSYPTWIFSDGERVVGKQSLEFLAYKTGCTLPEET